MKKICSLITLFCLISAFASAATTWTVKQDGTGDATTVRAAVALANPGDTINIAQFTQPFDEGGSITLNGLTLTSTAPTMPTIVESGPASNVAGTFVWCHLNPCTISNIKFLGFNRTAADFTATAAAINTSLTSTGACLLVHSPLTLNNCWIAGFSTAIWAGESDATLGIGGPLGMTITNNYIVYCDLALDLTAVAATDTIATTITLSHNTMQIGAGFGCFFDDAYCKAGQNCSEVVFTNNYLYTQFGRALTLGDWGPQSGQPNYQTTNQSLTGAMLNPNVTNFKYNCFVGAWMISWDCTDPNSPTNGVEVVEDPTNIRIYGTGQAADTLYLGLINTDYTLPANSVMNKAASDGTNIGASQTTKTTIGYDFAIRQDGTGSYPTLKAALIARNSNVGKTFLLQQWTGNFNESVTAAMSLSNYTTIMAAPGIRPVITTTDATKTDFIFAAGAGCRFINVTIDAGGKWGCIDNNQNNGGSIYCNNCMFENATNGAIYTFNLQESQKRPGGGLIQDCYFINCRSGVHINDWQGSNNGPYLNLTNYNMVIDHNTFVNDAATSGPCVQFDTNVVPFLTTANFTLSNNIFDVASAIPWLNTGLGLINSNGVQPSITLSHNDYYYPAGDMRSSWAGTTTPYVTAAGGPLALGPGELDNVNPNFGTTNYDLVSNSRLIHAASDGTNIGANQATQVDAARSWNLFD